MKKEVTPFIHADHGFRLLVPTSKGRHMSLNLSNEFFEAPAVHFEMIKRVGMDIGFTQLKPGFLEILKKDVDTPEDLAEIMKDLFRRISLRLETCGNAIRQHETHISLYAPEILHETRHVSFRPVPGPC